MIHPKRLPLPLIVLCLALLGATAMAAVTTIASVRHFHQVASNARVR